MTTWCGEELPDETERQLDVLAAARWDELWAAHEAANGFGSLHD